MDSAMQESWMIVALEAQNGLACRHPESRTELWLMSKMRYAGSIVLPAYLSPSSWTTLTLTDGNVEY